MTNGPVCMCERGFYVSGKCPHTTLVRPVQISAGQQQSQLANTKVSRQSSDERAVITTLVQLQLQLVVTITTLCSCIPFLVCLCWCHGLRKPIVDNNIIHQHAPNIYSLNIRIFPNTCTPNIRSYPHRSHIQFAFRICLFVCSSRCTCKQLQKHALKYNCYTI